MATITEIAEPIPQRIELGSLPEPRSRFSALLNSSTAQILATVALYSLLPVIFIRAFYVIDPDIWWHLRTGQWILDHGTVPMTDPFSVYGAGKPWIAYSWLFDVFMAMLHGRFGLVGIAAYEIAARLALSIALFHLVRGLLPRFWPAAALTAVGLFSMMQVIGPRPGMLTILFVILQLDILLSAQRSGNTKILWFLPPLYLLWANYHIEFVNGLLILGLFACEPLINRLLRYQPVKISSLPARQLWLALGASTLATLINPYGARLYSTVFLYMGQSGRSKAFNLISELSAMTFRQPQHFAVVLLLACAALAIGWRRDLRPLWLMLLALASMMAFRMVREIWFLAVVSLCVICDGWDVRPAETSSSVDPKIRRQALVGVWVLAVVIAACQHYGLSNLQLEVQVAGTFPEGAAQFIEQHHVAGPLLNDLSWGGFLIWRLPELPVSMDGRTNVHGEERIVQYSTLWKGKPGWSTTPDLERANVVITPKDAAIASLLRTESHFEVAYEDVQAVVFQRK